MLCFNKKILASQACRSDDRLKEICGELEKIKAEKQASATFQDLGKLRKRVTEVLQSNQKIIFVTHSAGAMFADRARDSIITYLPSYKDYTSHLAIARPLKSTHINKYDVIFDKDPLISFLREEGLPVPDTNVTLLGSCGEEIYDNHNFSCYLSNQSVSADLTIHEPDQPKAIDVIKDGIYKVASFLGNNDKGCCEKGQGKIWLNWGNDNGGFVGKSMDVSGNIVIHEGVSLCGNGKIEGSSFQSEIRGGTEIEGHIEIAGYFILENLKIPKKSMLQISEPYIGTSGYPQHIRDSQIEGKLTSHYVPEIKGTSFKGNVKFEDNTNLTDTEFTAPLEEESIVESFFHAWNSKITLNNSIDINGFMSIEESDVLFNTDITSEDFNIWRSNLTEGFGLTGEVEYVSISNSTFTHPLIISVSSIPRIVMADFSSDGEFNLSVNDYFRSINVKNIGSLTVNSCNMDLGNSSSHLDLIGNNIFSGNLDVTGSKITNSTIITPCDRYNQAYFKNEITALTHNGELTITDGFIGSGVTISGGFYSDLPYSVADNTTILGPLSLECNISGTVDSSFECPEKIEDKLGQWIKVFF